MKDKLGLPWKYDDVNLEIKDSKGNKIIDCYNEDTSFCTNENESQFIVKAVNNYHELVGFIKKRRCFIINYEAVEDLEASELLKSLGEM